MPRPTILSVGKDAKLLCDRNRSLRESGYVVVAARNRNEAIVFSREQYFDLIVLCWSFGDDSESISSALAVVCPGAPVLVLQPPEQGLKVESPSLQQEVERILGSVTRHSIA
jgi:ActR/RegA family two-component response regulator